MVSIQCIPSDGHIVGGMAAAAGAAVCVRPTCFDKTSHTRGHVTMQSKGKRRALLRIRRPAMPRRGRAVLCSEGFTWLPGSGVDRFFACMALMIGRSDEDAAALLLTLLLLRSGPRYIVDIPEKDCFDFHRLMNLGCFVQHDNPQK